MESKPTKLWMTEAQLFTSMTFVIIIFITLYTITCFIRGALYAIAFAFVTFADYKLPIATAFLALT